MKNSKNKKIKIKKKSLKKKLLHKFPQIYRVNRISDKKYENLSDFNLMIDKIDFPNDYDYFKNNVIKIAQLWDTPDDLFQRCSYDSYDVKDLFNKSNKNKYKQNSKQNFTDDIKYINFLYKAGNLDDSKIDAFRALLDDAATDFNTFNFLDNLESRLRFIKLIIETFTLCFSEIYKKTDKYNSNNLNIMAKGGTLIRFVIMEYIRGFSKEIEDFLINDIKKNVKLSDYDFEIMTKPNMNKNDFIKLNVITFLLSILIRNYLFKNRFFFFDFFKLSNKSKQQKVSQLKENMQKIIDDNNSKIPDSSLFKNIQIDYIDFENCHNNIMYNVDNPTNIQKYKSLSSISKSSDSKYCKRDYAIIADGSKDSIDKENDDILIINSSELFDKYNIPKEIINKILYPYKSKKSNDPGRKIYNRFVTSHNPVIDLSFKKPKNKKIKFQLNRIKYIYNIYFRKILEINGTKKTIFIKHPILGEILDLSHAYREDRKKYKFESDFNINSNFASYSFLNYDLDFISYSIEGFISDLDSIIFAETSYKPWEDNKYAKRLKRTLYLYIFYFFSTKVKIGDKYKLLDLNKLLEHIGSDFCNLRMSDFNTQSSVFINLVRILQKTSENNKETEYGNFKDELFRILTNLKLAFEAQMMTSKKLNFAVGPLNNNLLHIDFPGLYKN